MRCHCEFDEKAFYGRTRNAKQFDKLDKESKEWSIKWVSLLVNCRITITLSIEKDKAVGEHVRAGGDVAYWVIVEGKATIGSGSSILLERPWAQRVRILANAKVPENMVINEAYCQQHAYICTIY